jgi:hypothetical protein
VVGHLLDSLLSLSGAEVIAGELLHGRRGAVEQVTGPGDGAGHYGQVTHDGWVSALLLVLLLDLGDKARVLVEEDTILAHEASLQVVAVEDAAELAEKAQRVLDVDDV